MESAESNWLVFEMKDNFTSEDKQNILFTENYEETFGDLGSKEVYHELLQLK